MDGSIPQADFKRAVQKLRTHVGKCLVVRDPKLGRVWLGFILNVKNLPAVAKLACTPTSFQNVVNSTRLGAAEKFHVNAYVVLPALHAMLLNAGFDTRSKTVYSGEEKVSYNDLLQAGFLP